MVVRKRKGTESRTLIYGSTQLCKKFEPLFLRRFLKNFIPKDNPFAASVVDFGGQTTVITTR